MDDILIVGFEMSRVSMLEGRDHGDGFGTMDNPLSLRGYEVDGFSGS